MPVEVDFDRSISKIRIALATQRTSAAVLGLGAGEQLFEAAVIGLDPFFYLFHAFACRTAIAICKRVIDKFVDCIRFLFSFLVPLIPVELVMLYIGSNPFVLQPLIVLFTAITRIRCDIGRLLLKGFYMLLQMGDQRSGIGRVGMQTVRGDKLVVSADLYIISRL